VRCSGCFSVSVLFTSGGLARRLCAGFLYGSFFVMIFLAMGPGGVWSRPRRDGTWLLIRYMVCLGREGGWCKIRYTV
jgi:hypothetical protein